jgi:hypothetical protein
MIQSIAEREKVIARIKINIFEYSSVLPNKPLYHQYLQDQPDLPAVKSVLIS